jgi:hypothetical protein
VKNSTRKQLTALIDAYNLLVKGIEQQAEDDVDRASGGVIRAGKGALVESIARRLIETAWMGMEQPAKRLSFEKKVIQIQIKPDYIKRVKSPEVAKWIKDNIHEFHYGIKTDVHVNIDGKFVCGVECKAYSENAMMKRILVDFTLLRQIMPDLACVLFQLESQLGGDYSKPNSPIIFGSKPTHTLISHFDVDLHIITILEGDRKVDEPIHDPQFFKELKFDLLERAMITFQQILGKWA